MYAKVFSMDTEAVQNVLLLTPTQAAVQLACSRGHMYRLIRAGQIACIDIALPNSGTRRIRISVSELTDYVARNHLILQPKGEPSASLHQ